MQDFEGQCGDLGSICDDTSSKRRRAEEGREQARREISSGVQPWDLGAELDEAIFQGGRQRPTQTRSQKRQKRHQHSQRVCPELPADTGLNISGSELQKFQETDPTLSTLRKVSGQEVDSGGGSDVSLVVKNGLMYRVKARSGELPGREQLVLPNQCHRVVIELAHSIPLAGHLGRNKTIG